MKKQPLYQIVVLCMATLSLLLCACATAPTATPNPSATPAPPDYVNVKINSAAIAKNLIHEPAERNIFVYLPPSYATSDKHYPVVYFLPGYGNRSMGVPYAELNPLFLDGTLKEMIVVIAPGDNQLGGSFYVNSPVSGNWQDFIVNEVVGYVDSHYRTIPKPEARGISGHSMGGFGSLNIAMQYPDLFGSVYSLSPGIYDPKGVTNSQFFNVDYTIEKFLNGKEKVLAKPADKQLDAVLSKDYVNYQAVSYGFAFIPQPDKPPFYFDYPYSMSDGKLVRDDMLMQQWQENGFGRIPALLPKYKDNWKKLHGIVIDYGTHDGNVWIIDGCVYFDKLLTEAGIKHEMAVHDGDHETQLGQRVREHMLPFFSKILAAE